MSKFSAAVKVPSRCSYYRLGRNSSHRPTKTGWDPMPTSGLLKKDSIDITHRCTDAGAGNHVMVFECDNKL